MAQRLSINTHFFQVFVLVIAWAWGFGSAAHADDFRNATWGMSFDDVIDLHPRELPADRRIGYVAFSSTLAGLDVEIFYEFNADAELVAAGYSIHAEPERSQEALEEYNTLNSLLRKRYPDSLTPERKFTKQTFAEDPAQWGRALRVGQLTVDWQHALPRTEIRHVLSGSRREVSHTLRYRATLGSQEQNALDQL